VILGPFLTAWTIRAALVCYVAYLGGWLTVRSDRWPAMARWIWTIGCGLFLGHVACAFHFFHHWSHAAAWHDTAEQTQRLIGVAFGDGIYFSYLFLILWVFDVAWLWIAETNQAEQPVGRWIDYRYGIRELLRCIHAVTAGDRNIRCCRRTGCLARRRWHSKPKT
jgi:hypothetical protein